MASSLLPDRHPVKDFFVLDVLDVVPRSDMASMEHPIFSLCTKPDSRVLNYTNGDVALSIRPSGDGLPTVFDKDILIYCISKLVHMKNAGCPIGPAVRLTTHDMLVQTNRPTNNLGYERLLPALRRLKGTTIETTVATGDEVTTKGFGLIDEFEYNRKGSMHAERLRFLEVKLSDWLFRAIDSCEVLPINRRYFRLRRPIDRRLYELARKHCGRQPSWRVGFDILQKKWGSKQEDKHFAAHLRGLAQSNHLPDYELRLDFEHAVFSRREAARPAAERAGIVPPSPAPLVTPDGQKRSIIISQSAMEQMCDAAPGWDRYMLEKLYIDWAAGKDTARDEDARFLSWARSFTKGKVNA